MRTAWWRTSSPGCPGSNGCSSSLAIRASFTKAGRSTFDRQGESSACAISWKAASVRSGSRVRVTAQLVEAETGAHLWADKFDGELKDVFDFQDRITDSVVGIVEPSVRRSEIERSRRKRPESLDAYDLYLRALPLMTTISVADAPAAAALLRDALRLDPNLAVAHAYLSWSSPNPLRPWRFRRGRQDRRA